MLKVKYAKWLSWLCVLGVMSRLLPHVANATPLLALAFFTGEKGSVKWTYCIFLLSLFISDIGLHSIYGYPLLGSWTFFVYSGVGGVILLSTVGRRCRGIVTGFVFMATLLGYWVWTNLGTWLCSGLYLHTWQGLLNCFLLALPFLQHSLLANMMGYGMLKAIEFGIDIRQLPNSHSVKNR